ncbi:MAG TPA: DUF1993 domain-containing protein [Hyphomonas sp.]|nr:DUF1993 domain-containing protein [Hyphomonas sp.]HRJ02430.1 DUF1993 domain-containing protein [Hyphomonas sp.]HRK68065.1 DUF1993 domain-containing protein [Hyphomonas sp.]
MTTTVSYILKKSTEQTLGALKGLLSKGEAYAKAINCDEAGVLAQRLYPDMYALPRQVQIACDTVARGAARLASLDMPSFPDTEQTFAELIARCDKAIAYVNSVDDAKIDATTKTTLQIPMGSVTLPMTGEQYLQGFILTNLHFHAAMAYALLRKQGVQIGKRDYLVPA